MMDLNNYLKENKFKNKDTNKLNRVSATIVEAVLEVDENGNEIPLKYNGKEVSVDNVQYAMVRIMGYKNLQIVLPNKTNAPLETNNNVWVYFWNNISSGYIALNNDTSEDILSVYKNMNVLNDYIANAEKIKEVTDFIYKRQFEDITKPQITNGLRITNNITCSGKSISDTVSFFEKIHTGTIKAEITEEPSSSYSVEISDISLKKLAYTPTHITATVRIGNIDWGESTVNPIWTAKIGVTTKIDGDSILFYIYNSWGTLKTGTYYIDYMIISK